MSIDAVTMVVPCPRRFELTYGSLLFSIDPFFRLP